MTLSMCTHKIVGNSVCVYIYIYIYIYYMLLEIECDGT